jgi:hypothetical protein
MAERDTLWTNWVLTHSPRVTVKVLRGLVSTDGAGLDVLLFFARSPRGFLCARWQHLLTFSFPQEAVAVVATFLTLWCCVPHLDKASRPSHGAATPKTLWLSLWLLATAALQLLALPLRVHLLYLLWHLKGGSGVRVQLARTLQGPSWRGKKVVGQTTLVLLIAGALCLGLGAHGESPIEVALWQAVLWAECAMVTRTIFGVTALTLGLRRYGAASKEELLEELRSAVQLFKHGAAGGGGRKGSSSWVLPTDCAVCLEDLVEGEKLARLPCTAGGKTGGHVFHASCIMTWLVKSPSCPLCSAGVLPGVIDSHVD